MTAVLFVGPSLHGLRPLVPSDIQCLPPAAAGDIARAVAQGASRVGLVDGVFGTIRTPWHKEIILALSQGVPVLGAGSLGALRVAECAGFGMLPVGVIADDYLSGRRTADSDVALLHAPAALDYRPLTLPLVDAEDTISTLAETGRIDLAARNAMLASARDLHFSRRTWNAVVAKAGLKATLIPLLQNHAPGLKARDALALVARLPMAPPPAAPWPQPVMTAHFLALLSQSKA